MGYTLRDTVSLKEIVDRMIQKVPGMKDTVLQDDIARAVGNRRYFFKDEVDSVENEIQAQQYKRLTGARESDVEEETDEESVEA